MLHCAAHDVKKAACKDQAYNDSFEVSFTSKHKRTTGETVFQGKYKSSKYEGLRTFSLIFFLMNLFYTWRCGPLLRFRGFERASAHTGRLLALSLADLRFHSYIVMMYLHSTVPVLRIKVFKGCDQFHYWCHGQMALYSLGTFFKVTTVQCCELIKLRKRVGRITRV